MDPGFPEDLKNTNKLAVDPLNLINQDKSK